MKNEYHIPISLDDRTALDWLSENFDKEKVSRQKIKQIMQKGCVWLEKENYIQRLRRAKKILHKGDILHCYYDPTVLAQKPIEASLIHDEGDYSIWNKPSGMLSQGSKWGDHSTIYRWAEQHLQPERPAFIVHRLDKAASGLIILAHKKQVAAKFSELFKTHLIEKHYAVTVVGDFSNSLNKDEYLKTITTPLDNKSAISHIRFLNYDATKQQSTLDVHIETGRKHQIRKHLSTQGYAVVGDRLYGDKNSQYDLQLCATSLSFLCPITNILKSYKI